MGEQGSPLFTLGSCTVAGGASRVLGDGAVRGHDFDRDDAARDRRDARGRTAMKAGRESTYDGDLAKARGVHLDRVASCMRRFLKRREADTWLDADGGHTFEGCDGTDAGQSPRLDDGLSAVRADDVGIAVVVPDHLDATTLADRLTNHALGFGNRVGGLHIAARASDGLRVVRGVVRTVVDAVVDAGLSVLVAESAGTDAIFCESRHDESAPVTGLSLCTQRSEQRAPIGHEDQEGGCGFWCEHPWMSC